MCAPYSFAEIGMVPYALALRQEGGYEQNITQFADQLANVVTDHIMQRIRSVSATAVSALGVDDCMHKALINFTGNIQERVINCLAKDADAKVNQYIIERKATSTAKYLQSAANDNQPNASPNGGPSFDSSFGQSGVAAGDGHSVPNPPMPSDEEFPESQMDHPSDKAANDNDVGAKFEQGPETKKEPAQIMVGGEYVAGSEHWAEEDEVRIPFRVKPREYDLLSCDAEHGVGVGGESPL